MIYILFIVGSLRAAFRLDLFLASVTGIIGFLIVPLFFPSINFDVMLIIKYIKYKILILNIIYLIIFFQNIF